MTPDLSTVPVGKGVEAATDVEIHCTGGCDRVRIADQLHLRRIRLRADLPDEMPPASSWIPLDLEAIITGEHAEQPPTILKRTDGVALFYSGRVHFGAAEPEAGKSWLAQMACAEQMAAGELVLYIDYEDTSVNVVNRLRALGVDGATLLARFKYVRPEEPITKEARDALVALGSAYVTIDGVTAALTIEGLDLASNQDIAEFHKRLCNPFARAGAAVFLPDHVTKAKESRGRYALGAGHKLAGVDVAYSLEVVRPFGRGREGVVKITVVKDRPGYVREHADDAGRIATLKLTSHEDGRVAAVLEPPNATTPTFRPTFLMERLSARSRLTQASRSGT